VLVAIALGWLVFARADRDGSGAATPSGTQGGGSNIEGAAGAAYDAAVPEVREVVDGDLVYSLISASVTPQGTTRELRVRVRAANDGSYDANFWDAAFRLVLPDGSVLAPHSGLNEIATSHSVRDGVIAFAVPEGVTRATLKITGRPGAGEIPLGLGPAGRPARDEHADAGDVLARAIIREVVREPRPLLARSGLQVTLTRVLVRRFANAARLIVRVRYSNRSGSAVAASSLTLRAAVADQVLAPASVPMQVIENESDGSGDFVFDLPPAASRVTLRALMDDARANVALALD
jgi:hypothetical protein